MFADEVNLPEEIEENSSFEFELADEQVRVEREEVKNDEGEFETKLKYLVIFGWNDIRKIPSEEISAPQMVYNNEERKKLAQEKEALARELEENRKKLEELETQQQNLRNQQQDNAINQILVEWKNQQIEGKVIAHFLPADWRNQIRTQKTQAEINNLRDIYLLQIKEAATETMVGDFFNNAEQQAEQERETRAKNAAATKIQAFVRGQQARKEAERLRKQAAEAARQEAERLAQEAARHQQEKKRQEAERLAQEQAEQAARQKQEQEAKQEKELISREQIYDDLLKKIETSAKPEEHNLDQLDYNGLRDGRTRTKLEAAQKSRQATLEAKRLAQERAERERTEREAHEKAERHATSNHFFTTTQPTNSNFSATTEKKTPDRAEAVNQNNPNLSTNNDFTNSRLNNSENITSPASAPGGGDYSGGGTTAAEKFIAPKSPSQIIQDILKQAEKAIESKKIPPLETAEKKITELFEEKDPNKKQIYYAYQPELENKLEKVIQTKTIQEIQINHLDIAKKIKENIEPQKIQGKDWKEVINNTKIEKIASYKKQIQSDILQQTKKVAIESIEEDLKIARPIKPDIKPNREKKQNWKLIIENSPNEENVKKEWEENKQNILAQTQEAIVNNLNSLLGQELKIADLDSPFREFPTEVWKKELVELTAYRQQVAAHIAEKKRNYSQVRQLNNAIFSTQQKEERKEWILPLTIGVVGTIGGIAALNYWLSSKAKTGKNHREISPNTPTKIKFLMEQYLVNLRKLQKNGYDAKLVQEINNNLEQIQVLTEKLKSQQKLKFDEHNWNDLQEKYKTYKEKHEK